MGVDGILPPSPVDGRSDVHWILDSYGADTEDECRQLQTGHLTDSEECRELWRAAPPDHHQETTDVLHGLKKQAIPCTTLISANCSQHFLGWLILSSFSSKVINEELTVVYEHN
jgi:hypothetical protein